MSNKWGIKPEQAEILLELERLMDKSIQIVEWPSFPGAVIKEENIIELGLENCELTSLPESIGNLTSLQKLYLSENRLTALPESIGNLTSLEQLNLGDNKLNTLPESIGNLPSIQWIDLEKNQLKILPESIGNLTSLLMLSLGGNNFTIFPESITKLASLLILSLSDNQLTTLPESIGDLISLEELYLDHNNLIIFPEPITKLTSLQKLNLRLCQIKTIPTTITKLTSLKTLNLEYNRLTSLPDSMWLLSSLETIKLEYNRWEGEWKELANRDAVTLLRILKQRVSINIFISHTVNEFVFYKIKDLAEYLGKQPEINQVYFCEEDLKGNIDAWMEETVPKSQLLLFIGTQQSIFYSRDCSNELFLARKHNIEVTPIKGIDASWEDLTKVGLSRELGFEFDEKNFDKLCENLYSYIYEFKRERDLLGKEIDKIQDSKLRIASILKESIASEALNEIFTNNFSEIESLEKDFKSNKIKFSELLKKLGDLLD